MNTLGVYLDSDQRAFHFSVAGTQRPKPSDDDDEYDCPICGEPWWSDKCECQERE